jgi:cell division protein FtsI (penicillin-binding protein 3)
MFAGRLIQIQGMESGFYRNAAQSEKLTTLPLSALRGTIYGADGQILAMTVQTYTVWSDPPQIHAADKANVAQQLAAPLGMPAQQILDMLLHPTSPHYVVLKKNVAAAQGDQISALNVAGIYETASFARDWPDGDATANVVGFTSTDPKSDVISGQAGIELAYNKLLSGTPGSEQVEVSNDGQPIPLAGSKSVPARNGSGIRLTIIPALQLEAQQVCQQRVRQTHARQCTIVIIAPKTGYILAMAQWPTFSYPVTTMASVTDLPAQAVFEPGSTAKVITAAAALERGGQTPMSAYNIPYQIYEGGQSIRDAEWSPGERYTIAGIIANSSNVGMSQVVKHVPPQVQYDYLRAFGLGRPTGLNMPGETQGILPPPSQWAGDERYTLSFGQGIAVSAIQMASVYATIANDGVRVQPTLVEGTYSASGKYTPAPPPQSRRVIQVKTARELRAILQQVPAVDQQANQPWGIIPGYAVAAKTGTSQETDPSCPAKNPLCIHGSSFIGMAPGDNPQVVVAVNVQDPRKNNDYFGDVVAGPVFYNVMEFALATLQIPPDGAVAPHVRLNAP